MKLVIGGAFQGKYQYARKTFGIQDGWIDGDTCSWNEIFECRGILHFHDYVQRRLRAGKSVDGLAEELLEKNPDIDILKGGSLQTNIFTFNMKKAPFDDPKVRQAVSLSLIHISYTVRRPD